LRPHGPRALRIKYVHLSGAVQLRGSSKETPVRPGFEWILVATVFLVSAINYADRSSITALFPLLKRDLGFNDVGLGAIGSLFLWSYAFASPVSGYVGDRFDRGRIIVWSLAGWSLITLVSGLVAAQWQLLSMRFLLGLVESMYLPAAMALVAQHHPPKTRATALALMGLGNYAGLMGGGAIGGYLGGLYGWRAPLCVLGLVGIILAPVCYFILCARDKTAGDVSTAAAEPLSFIDAARRLLGIPSFVILAIAGVLTSIGAWIFINWLPLYFKESFSMSLAAAGFLGSSLVPIGAAVSQTLGGPVSDLLARRGPQYRMLMQAVLIGCAAPTLLVFVVTHNRTAIIAALILYSVFRSCGDLNMIPLIFDLAGKDKASTAFGITNMVNSIAGGLGIFVAGWVKADFGLAGVFTAVAGILVFDALMLFSGYALFVKKDLAASAAA